MNFEIDDPCTVYVVRWMEARKPHRCACCYTLIQAGAQYRRDHMVSDGRGSDEACCFCCAVALWQMAQWFGSHPSPAWAMEFIRESLEHRNYRRDPQQARMRSLLAGMVRRNRVSERVTR